MQIKHVLLAAFVVTTTAAIGQETIFPGDKAIQAKWIKEENYSMKWYRVKDTVRQEMGDISTSVSIKDQKIYIVQHVNLKKATATWVDSTVADIKTINPVYHSSRNTQREMVLNFGNIITGYYQDNMQKKTDLIHDTVPGRYFDSNIYTSLLGWFPLEEGYTAKLPIYDYNNSEKHGIVYVTINSVTLSQYTNTDNTSEEAFVLNITDGITGSNSVFYFSVKDRRLLKIVAFFGPVKFEMVRQ